MTSRQLTFSLVSRLHVPKHQKIQGFSNLRDRATPITEGDNIAPKGNGWLRAHSWCFRRDMWPCLTGLTPYFPFLSSLILRAAVGAAASHGLMGPEINTELL